MQKIGQVKFVQVQKNNLKSNEGTPTSSFSPQAIEHMAYLRLSADGIIGVRADDTNVIDVHHTMHSTSRNTGSNGISAGFTPHYAAIQARFGQHVMVGAGGENIMIETAERFPPEYIGRQLVIQSSATQKETYFTVNRSVAPCQEFSKFCTQNPQLGGAEMKETLQFLSDGQRGMMLALAPDQGHIIIQAGDVVYLVDG